MIDEETGMRVDDEIVVNLTTAKALGLAIPASFLSLRPSADCCDDRDAKVINQVRCQHR